MKIFQYVDKSSYNDTRYLLVCANSKGEADEIIDKYFDGLTKSILIKSVYFEWEDNLDKPKIISEFTIPDHD